MDNANTANELHDNADDYTPAGIDWDDFTDEDLATLEECRWQAQVEAGRRHRAWLEAYPDAGSDVARR